ncbi:MAG: PAS domain-containing protein [Dechloromonas sp.]|uniref:PAS domain-containing protein n=1 Tax=Candidatus Dechloromonas phosphorivorans TaxID=2899244 RepID=A0A935N272_9RHOO|nr:PAS domain-containing protein [Candidatus Dechloromonas phosphorivorans]
MPTGSGQENLVAWLERISPDEKKPLSQAFSALIRGITPLLEHQLRVRCRSGDYHWLEMRGKVMEWSLQGRAMRIVGSIRDIEEERRRAEIEQSRQERMLHTARLVSVGEIASALAHEVNQPLTAICNFSAVALHKLKAGAPEQEPTGLMQTIAEMPCAQATSRTRFAALSKRAKPRYTPYRSSRLSPAFCRWPACRPRHLKQHSISRSNPSYPPYSPTRYKLNNCCST